MAHDLPTTSTESAARRQRPRGAHAVASGTRARRSVPAPPGGGQRFRIPAMDCASEESEIRRAVEGIPGVLGLRFQLGERSLRIAGEPQAALAAVEAIRNTGFGGSRWPDAPGVDPTTGMDRTTTTSTLHHRSGPAPPAGRTRPPRQPRACPSWPGRTLVEVGGLAVAAAAIALAGLAPSAGSDRPCGTAA